MGRKPKQTYYIRTTVNGKRSFKKADFQPGEEEALNKNQIDEIIELFEHVKPKQIGNALYNLILGKLKKIKYACNKECGSCKYFDNFKKVKNCGMWKMRMRIINIVLMEENEFKLKKIEIPESFIQFLKQNLKYSYIGVIETRIC